MTILAEPVAVHEWPGVCGVDPVGDALVADLVSAVDAEVNIEGYLAYRDGGATHGQAI
jgi:hypothetical protein